MDKQPTDNPIAVSGDAAIMLALTDIINKTPDGIQKDYKMGLAIILMLKRVKLRELMMKQIKATTLWSRYVRQQKESGSKDPILRNRMEIIPEPTKKSLDQFKGKRKLLITIPFIDDWYDDIDYLRHIPEVMELFKIDREKLIKHIEIYLKKEAMTSVMSDPTTNNQNRIIRICQIREYMDQKIDKLRNNREFQFRQAIYYPTEMRDDTDFREDNIELNRDKVLKKSKLIINSQSFPQDFEKNLLMTIGLGNAQEDITQVEKQLRSFTRIVDNNKRAISRPEDEMEFIKKYFVYFIHKPDVLNWEEMLNNMELTSTDMNNESFLEKPILPTNTAMRLIPETKDYSIGAVFQLKTVNDSQNIFFFQIEIELGESFNNDVLKKSRDLYNKKKKAAFSHKPRYVNAFEKSEEEEKKEREEKLAAAKKRREQKRKGKKKAPVTNKPPAYSDADLLDMFAETPCPKSTKGKKKKKKKKKKKSQNNNLVQEIPSAPQAKSGKISPTQLATAPLIQGRYDEKLYKYLIDVCMEKDVTQAIIWSVINKYLKNGGFDEKCYYSGGFATYLLTKGKYPTTDIDYKIYPSEPNVAINKDHWEKHLKDNKDNMFEDIKDSLPEEMKEYYSELVVSRPKIDSPIKIVLKLTKEEIIQLKEPELDKGGTMIFSKKKFAIAYCDIGFWSQEDLINDLDLPFIDNIYPKHDEPLLKKLDMYVIDKDFMIAEKEIFLKKLNNKSMLHKITNWTNQLKLLKGITGGRKTRRKRRKKKKRTKKKKKRGKKKKGSGIGCSKPIRVTPINLPLNVVPGVVVHEVTVNAPTASELRMAVPYDDGERDAGMRRLRQGLNNNNSTRPINPLRQVLENNMENNRRNQEQRRLQQLQERINSAWEGGKRKKKRKKKTKKRKRRKRRKKTRRR